MPHHSQFKKSLRQNPKRSLRNRIAISRLRTFVKKIRTADSKDKAQDALRKAISVIDSTARRGIIKKQTAARQKSRLSKFVAQMQ
ncbi:MAG: 30S ribosomal protein S20 [Candidatus Latescibacteria bacterium]|nr:30S ribosomal protein S20 [Candidatus Latescibacterota bacterium]